MLLPPLSLTFTRKKAKILQDLSVIEAEYSDKSPKGTVDEGIRELIEEINAYEGFVTTSSCAGRISVFEEGIRNGKGGEGGTREEEEEEEEELAGRQRVPGGKGSGSFLFVSHEPVRIVSQHDEQLQRVFGQGPEAVEWADGGGNDDNGDPSCQRLVRFAFEPMILHIMTASLHHAKPLLSAAINSGFRESGVQSLKNLHDPDACPMVAVRTAGLGVEAITGVISGENRDGSHRVRCLVSEGYRLMLLRLANERFVSNKQRIDRFRLSLKEAMRLEREKLQQGGRWESDEARRKRKREEGLRRQEGTKIADTRNIQSVDIFANDDDQGCLQPHAEGW